MRFILLILLFFIFSLGYSQQKFIKYFDSVWTPTIKEKASFYTEFEKIDTFYTCVSYYYPSNKLYGKSTFLDTLFQKGIGKIVRYYEDGLLKDSGFFFQNPEQNFSVDFTYHKNGKVKDSTYRKGAAPATSSLHYCYSENGKLKGFSSYDYAKELWESIGYDDNGNPIPNYIFEKEAQFPDGIKGWARFLTESLNSRIPARKKAPNGKYIVHVSFWVDIDGKVIDVKALNNPGFGSAEEAVRVIKRSPDWLPAIKENNPVKFKHIQRITFVVNEEN